MFTISLYFCIKLTRDICKFSLLLNQIWSINLTINSLGCSLSEPLFCCFRSFWYRFNLLGFGLIVGLDVVFIFLLGLGQLLFLMLTHLDLTCEWSYIIFSNYVPHDTAQELHISRIGIISYEHKVILRDMNRCESRFGIGNEKNIIKTDEFH